MSSPESEPAWNIPRLPARLCVMLSGTGRTFVNLLGAIRSGTLSAEVAVVIASRECPGAEHARRLGIPTCVMPGDLSAERLEGVLAEHRVDVVALAGYLRKLCVPPTWRGRIVNIHPALLPKFGGSGMYGDRVHSAVLAAGEQESGCTVHLVDDEYDRGRILLQRRCPVLPGDDASRLAARVFAEECLAYPAALQQMILSHVQPNNA